MLSQKQASRLFANCQNEEEEELTEDATAAPHDLDVSHPSSPAAERQADDEMVYPEFVEALCAAASFVVREP